MKFMFGGVFDCSDVGELLTRKEGDIKNPGNSYFFKSSHTGKAENAYFNFLIFPKFAKIYIDFNLSKTTPLFLHSLLVLN